MPLSSSVGGGRGFYKNVDGDRPIAMLNAVTLPSVLARKAPGVAFACDKGDPGTQQPDNSDNNRADDDEIRFAAISWNACGMELGAVHGLIDQLRLGQVHWDAILMQEGPYAEDNLYSTLPGGHALFLGKCLGTVRSVGILLHKRWVHSESRLSFFSVGRRIVYANVVSGSLRTRLTSVHMPHGGAQ